MRYGRVLYLLPHGLGTENIERRGTSAAESRDQVERGQLRSDLADRRERVRAVRQGLDLDDHQFGWYSLHDSSCAGAAREKVKLDCRRNGNADSVEPSDLAYFTNSRSFKIINRFTNVL